MNNIVAPEGRFDRFMKKLLRAEGVKLRGQAKETIAVRDTLRFYWKAAMKRPRALTIMFVMAILGPIAGLFFPVLIKRFADMLALGDRGEAAIDGLVITALLVCALELFSWFTSRMLHFSICYLESEVMAELKHNAFAYLIKHSHRFFSSTFTGALTQRINRFAHAFERVVDRIIFDVIPLFIGIVGAIIIVGLEYTPIAWAIVGCFIVFVAWNWCFALWKLKYDVTAAAEDSRTTGLLADTLTNHPAVESHASYDFERSRYEKQVRTQAQVTRLSWNLGGVLDAIQGLVVRITQFVVLLLCVWAFARGEFTAGTFILVQLYLFQISDRLWSFGRVIRDFYQAFADAKEMTEVQMTPHELTDLPGARTLAEAHGGIDLTEVVFGYRRDDLIVDGLTLHINPGEHVALIGPSGAGKSTIMKLLQRSYDPLGGSIAIDGVDIREYTLLSLRAQLAVVSQEPTLFHRSIFENIRYGRQSATDEEVYEAARRARCEEFVAHFPNGYQTRVGERGVMLSGGERQRVVIARAILRNAPILLLDEATASLDSRSEHFIQEGLAELMRGKTSVVVAHRLSTICRADRIVVLDKGTIIETGTHDELLAKGGLYTELWSLQKDGFMPEFVLAQDKEVVCL